MQEFAGALAVHTCGTQLALPSELGAIRQYSGKFLVDSGGRPLSSGGFKWRGNSRFPRVAWWCLLLRATNPGQTSCQLGEFSFSLPM